MPPVYDVFGSSSFTASPVNRLSGSVAFLQVDSRLRLGSFDNAIDEDNENDNIVHHRVSTLKPLVLI